MGQGGGELHQKQSALIIQSREVHAMSLYYIPHPSG